MAFDPGAIDSTLAAAVGDDPALIAELRVAFVDGAERGLAALEGASDPAGWRDAAARLKGLAASFGAVRLMSAAEQAAAGPAFDAGALGQLRRLVARL